MSKKVKFRWWCPCCGIKHKWKWSENDIPKEGSFVKMLCEEKNGGCGSSCVFTWYRGMMKRLGCGKWKKTTGLRFYDRAEFERGER